MLNRKEQERWNEKKRKEDEEFEKNIRDMPACFWDNKFRSNQEQKPKRKRQHKGAR